LDKKITIENLKNNIIEIIVYCDLEEETIKNNHKIYVPSFSKNFILDKIESFIQSSVKARWVMIKDVDYIFENG